MLDHTIGIYVVRTKPEYASVEPQTTLALHDYPRDDRYLGLPPEQRGPLEWTTFGWDVPYSTEEFLQDYEVLAGPFTVEQIMGLRPTPSSPGTPAAPLPPAGR